MSPSDVQTLNAARLIHYISSHPMQASATLLLLVLVQHIIKAIATAYKPGLRSIPGPAVARFFPLYRPWRLAGGDAPGFYRALHERYGKIVRTGPKTVDISDPDAVSVIYGINSKFLKVGKQADGSHKPSVP
jgi:hypothetical protein